MAINATFKADFSSFFDAVNKAEAELIDLSKGASRVETSLNRMVDNFSGRKLVQDAALMEKAIESVGGTSKLTAKELDLVGVKANEAIAKLKALGQDVPPGLQKIATEAGGVTGGLTSMLGTASKLAAGFGIAFGVGAIVNFGKQILSTADTLTKLHDKTGISVEGLQRFQVAGDDAGNTIEDLSRAVTQMQNRLAGGDASAAGAIDRLGLSLETLQRMEPDRQFIAISDAIRQVQDPAEQVALAMDLFGKSGAEVLPTIKRGFDDVKDSAVGMSKEAVKALDDAGDAAGRLYRSTKSAIGEGLGALINRLVDDYHSLEVLSGRFVSDSDMAAKAQTGLAAALPKVTAGVKDLTVNETEQANIERKLGEQLRETQVKYKARTDAVTKAAAAQREFEKATTISLRTSTVAVKDFDIWDNQLTKGLIAQKLAALETAEAYKGKLIPSLGDARFNMAKTGEAVDDMATKIEGHLRDSLDRIPQMFIDAFTGGGGVIGALKGIGVDLLNAITKEILAPIWDSVAKWAGGIGRAIAGAFGGAGSAAAGLGSFTPGLIGGGGGGAAAGAGAGVGLGTAALATAGIAGAIALGGFIASTFDQPTPSNTMGGNGMTIAEAIARSNQMTPEERQAEFDRNNPELAAALEAERLGAQSSSIYDARPYGMAEGGRGRVTKPTLFLAGEAGPEDFAFSGGGKSFGGGGTQIIQVVLPDGRVLAEVVNDANDRTLRGRRKVRAA